MSLLRQMPLFKMASPDAYVEADFRKNTEQRFFANELNITWF